VLDFRAALTSPAAKKALYVSGALDAWHRRRNRNWLTVIMFHRVLATRDPRWPTSDPEYTLADDLFGHSLDFFKKHYNVVSLADLLAARAGERPLPERALLVTFDDGWSDNEEYALPHLKRTGLREADADKLWGNTANCRARCVLSVSYCADPAKTPTVSPSPKSHL
jgi:hypothetical protein